MKRNTASDVFEAGWRRFRRIWRPSVRDDVADEVAFHMEMRVAEFVATGLSHEDATRKARALFGDVGAVSEGLVRIGARRRRRLDFREALDATLLDLRLGARYLRAHPLFTLTAILTLTLGIGASAAIFSVVNAVLLEPLPYPHADRLVVITQEMQRRNVVDGALSLPDIEDIRAGASGLDGVAAMQTIANYPISIDGDAPESMTYAIASPNVFDVLGTPVVHGRGFRAGDGAPNPVVQVTSDSSGPPTFRRPRVWIISYALWQRRFHGDASVIGRTLVGPVGPAQIIGVASPRAELFFPARLRMLRSPDVWDVIQRDPQAVSRFAYGLRVVARMRPGSSADVVRSQIDSISRDLDRRFPRRLQVGLRLDVERMQDFLVGDVRPALVALMGAVLLVLLIACANVGNLLLVRASHRARELVVRAAIGGSPFRIVRQLLAEGLILAGISAALGVLFAMAMLRVLVRLAPATLPRLEGVGIDARVLVFAIGLAALSILIFALGPAIRAATPRLADALRATGQMPPLTATPRLRRVVVVAEVALSFVLLVGCGLMVRTFVTLLHTDLGFDPRGVLTFTLSNRNFRRAEDRVAYVHQVLDTLAKIPGVTGVTLSTILPLDGTRANATWGNATLGTPDAAGDRSQYHQGTFRAVLPNYFAVMRTPLLAGRMFSAADDRADQKIIIVDDVIAMQAYGTIDVVGKQLVARDDVQTIVGVVRHQRQLALAGTERGGLFFPWAAGNGQAGGWALRTSGDVNVLAGNVRAAIATIPIDYQSNVRAAGTGSNRLLVNDLQPMRAFVDRALAPTRFALMLIAIFAGIAAVLTAVGLYGVLSSSVRQRTSEIGLRMAFGAESSDIFSLVIGHGLKLSAIGLALGIPLALGGTRMMVSMLVGVRPTDPLTFGSMTLLFLAVALVACWLPARRAASLDPSVALREDAA